MPSTVPLATLAMLPTPSRRPPKVVGLQKGTKVGRLAISLCMITGRLLRLLNIAHSTEYSVASDFKMRRIQISDTTHDANSGKSHVRVLRRLPEQNMVAGGSFSARRLASFYHLAHILIASAFDPSCTSSPGPFMSRVSESTGQLRLEIESDRFLY